jgi:hypothetical protein
VTDHRPATRFDSPPYRDLELRPLEDEPPPISKPVRRYLVLGILVVALVVVFIVQVAASSGARDRARSDHPASSDASSGHGLRGTLQNASRPVASHPADRALTSPVPRGSVPPTLTDTVIGPAVTTIRGTASHVGRQFGPRYLALPEHRWGRPGITVTICGPADCVTRMSTDAGPDKAMQRQGRVADLNAWDFERVCGCSSSQGLVTVTVEYLGRGPTLPPLPQTDTLEGTP